MTPPGETTSHSSRAATDRLLSDLRAGRWRPRAWARFLAAAGVRSAQQAARHHHALLELTALHAAFALAGRRPRWIATSWIMCVLHLGMLQDRAHLGAANALTLTRANLPATRPPLGRWLSLAAMVADLIDGQLARHTSTTTPFGAYADPLADAAFWTWQVGTNQPQGARTHAARATVGLIWAAPAILVAVSSFRHGHMTDPPRPKWVRAAAWVQILLTAHALHKQRRPSPAATTASPDCAST